MGKFEKLDESLIESGGEIVGTLESQLFDLID
jgi:hypothetical protein